MQKTRVLNLYAGLGGNRALWEGVEVTAVEYIPGIAQAYQTRFPEDTVFCEDAHAFLLAHYDEYDVVWSSPPCQSHSRLNFFRDRQIYADLTLYQEILFLSQWFQGAWVVENVVPYYAPLIPPTVGLGRHLFWASFSISWKAFPTNRVEVMDGTIPSLKQHHKIPDNMSLVGTAQEKRQQLRNCVRADLGLYVFNEITEPPQLLLLEA